MFTDMIGYSALTPKNEALALELLDEHRQWHDVCVSAPSLRVEPGRLRGRP